MKNNRSFVVWALAGVIFTFGLIQGLSVAVRKPLWTDEIYSQMASVEGKRLVTMWQGGILEGNNAPLFYSVQKVICKITGFVGGDLWQKYDLTSMIVLRIAPVLFMSFGIAFLFWFFAYNYSMLMGFLALLLTMTTYLVWAYFSEARPYAMVFTFTAVQAIILMQAFRSKDPSLAWPTVMTIHLVLAFTTPLSVIQVGASFLMLWLAGFKRAVPLLLMVILPLAVGFWYHFSYKEHYMFWYASYGQPLALIKSAIPETRLLFIILAPLVLLLWSWRSGQKVPMALWCFIGWVWLTMLGYGVFLTYLWVKQKPNVGFEISNRYLMVLAPIGVAMVIFLFMELERQFKHLWAKVILWLILFIMIAPRLIKIFRWASTLH